MIRDAINMNRAHRRSRAIRMRPRRRRRRRSFPQLERASPRIYAARIYCLSPPIVIMDTHWCRYAARSMAYIPLYRADSDSLLAKGALSYSLTGHTVLRPPPQLECQRFTLMLLPRAGDYMQYCQPLKIPCRLQQ